MERKGRRGGRVGWVSGTLTKHDPNSAQQTQPAGYIPKGSVQETEGRTKEIEKGGEKKHVQKGKEQVKKRNPILKLSNFNSPNIINFYSYSYPYSSSSSSIKILFLLFFFFLFFLFSFFSPFLFIKYPFSHVFESPPLPLLKKKERRKGRKRTNQKKQKTKKKEAKNNNKKHESLQPLW